MKPDGCYAVSLVMQADEYFSISHLMKYSFKVNVSVIQYIIFSVKKPSFLSYRHQRYPNA